MSDPTRHYREAWAVDCEFGAAPGERPEVRCLVARELKTGRLLRFWADELATMAEAPFCTDAGSLFVAYYASAELGCFLQLGWSLPRNVLDLFAEFRVATNGRRVPSGNGLLGAFAWHGLDAMAGAEKDELRQLAIRGGAYSADERVALLDYCQTDVDALGRLLPRMASKIDLPRALLRGRYMAALARMERCGIPCDARTLVALRERWEHVKLCLIERIDADYGVFDGAGFRFDRFANYLVRNRIAWPRTETGRLATDADTFRAMAKTHAALGPLHELRTTLSELRLFDLAVGADGRNRCLLSPFRARTGRNQPSTSRLLFGPSAWVRSLIKPAEGRSIAYVDWAQQEHGIAAALSGDRAMADAYRSGDPYLAFAVQAGAVPPDATKASHPRERELYKACVLGVQYGMGADALAMRIGEPPVVGRRLLKHHREAYPTFWSWSDAAVNHAQLRGSLAAVFGWQIHVDGEANPRSLANFPMQANGAEMLRLACCLATKRGVEVCAPVHDAILIEGPSGSIADVVATARAAMAEASRIVLDGFELTTDACVVSWPNRYADERGTRVWTEIADMLGIDNEAADPPGDRYEFVTHGVTNLPPRSFLYVLCVFFNYRGGGLAHWTDRITERAPAPEPTGPAAERGRPKRLRRQSRQFIRGPLPLEWFGRAAALGRPALAVALALW